MDAVAYQMSFDKEQLALLCANYDRRIDSLGAENKKLKAENAKLRELVKALLTCATDGDCDECRLNGATPWHVGKAQLCDGVWDHVHELGVEVDG